MFFRSLIFLVLLLAGFAAELPAADSLEESRRSLQAILQRIEKASRDLEAKAESERILLGDLDAVETEMGRIRERLTALSRQLSSLEKDISARNREVEETRRQIRTIGEKVRQRLASLYKNGDTGVLRVLFSADSPTAMAREFVYMGRIVRRDRELLQSYRRRTQELETSLGRLETLRRERKAALAAQEGEQKVLRQAIGMKKDLLARVRSDKAALSAQLEKMRQRAARLGALIKKLESERPSEYTEKIDFFARQKGRLPWPASGAVRVGFGTGRHPELGTLYDSQGLEIAAAADAPISAVWSGRVIFADRFQGYGNLLIIDHGEGYYSLYAQASHLLKKVGDTVVTGDRIARAGYEGQETFYFEIRHRGTPLDPAAWLSPR